MIEKEELKDLLDSNTRLAEALCLHNRNRRSFKNIRHLEVISGFRKDKLKKKGLIETHSRGGYIILDLWNDRRFIISKNNPEQVRKAKELVKAAAGELQSKDIESPIDTQVDDLIGECLSNIGAFEEISEKVRFSEEGKFGTVSESEFSYPMITRMSKGFNVPDDMKPVLDEVLEEMDVNTDFAKRYWEVQQDSESGIFTAISSTTKEHHRLIYPKARDENLTDAEIGNLLLELEPTMSSETMEELRDPGDIEEAIEKIKSQKKSEVAD